MVWHILADLGVLPLEPVLLSQVSGVQGPLGLGLRPVLNWLPALIALHCSWDSLEQPLLLQHPHDIAIFILLLAKGFVLYLHLICLGQLLLHLPVLLHLGLDVPEPLLLCQLGCCNLVLAPSPVGAGLHQLVGVALAHYRKKKD